MKIDVWSFLKKKLYLPFAVIVVTVFSISSCNTCSVYALDDVDGSIDATFKTVNTDAGFAGAEDGSGIRNIAVQSDGKIIVGGYFTKYNNSTVNGIVRLNADGTRDVDFNTGTGFDGLVMTIAVQSDGKIIVGGIFTKYKDSAAQNIVRLNTDGTLDVDFNTGTGFTGSGDNSGVYSIAIQSDSKIIVGGIFAKYKDSDAKNIARLNTYGTLDDSFNTGIGFDASVLTIAVQSDGRIIVSGFFTKYNGKTINRVARLDSAGLIDDTFNTGGGPNSQVLGLIIQPSGKIIIRGTFTKYNGTDVNKIARINSDGSLDAYFIKGTGFNNDIYTMAAQPDGKIIVGGFFTKYNDIVINKLARINEDGVLDEKFIVGEGFSNSVDCLGFQPDGKIIVGGNFTEYNDISAINLIRLNNKKVIPVVNDGDKDFPPDAIEDDEADTGSDTEIIPAPEVNGGDKELVVNKAPRTAYNNKNFAVIEFPVYDTSYNIDNNEPVVDETKDSATNETAEKDSEIKTKDKDTGNFLTNNVAMTIGLIGLFIAIVAAIYKKIFLVKTK